MERRDSTMLLGKNLKKKKKKERTTIKVWQLSLFHSHAMYLKAVNNHTYRGSAKGVSFSKKKKKRLKTESLHDEKATYEKRKMTKNKLRNNNRKGALTTFKKKNNNNN